MKKVCTLLTLIFAILIAGCASDDELDVRAEVKEVGNLYCEKVRNEHNGKWHIGYNIQKIEVSGNSATAIVQFEEATYQMKNLHRYNVKMFFNKNGTAWKVKDIQKVN